MYISKVWLFAYKISMNFMLMQLEHDAINFTATIILLCK